MRGIWESRPGRDAMEAPAHVERQSPGRSPLLAALLVAGFLAGVIAVACVSIYQTGLPFAWQRPVAIDLIPYANANIAHDLVAGFPTGTHTPPNNEFGIPFTIPAEGNNFVIIESGRQNNPLSIPVNRHGIRRVFTMIQAFGPVAGNQIGRLEFIGGAGAIQSFDLIAGNQVRDFFESQYARTINDTTTRNAYQIRGQGGAFTGLVQTGATGVYDFDEQEFDLKPEFASQGLATIRLTSPEGNRPPILLAITADKSIVPTPAMLLRAAADLCLIACCLFLLAVLVLVVAMVYVGVKAVRAGPIEDWAVDQPAG